MSKRTHNDTILPGSRYRATHQASVDAILNPLNITRRVVSAGEDFLNKDNWFARALMHEFCIWNKKNPKRVPSMQEYGHIIYAANMVRVSDPYILIAETPDNLPSDVALALIGSAYHEAWHTYYSHRYPVTEKIAKDLFDTRAAVLDWHKLEDQLMFWSNLIEDIRIERAGCKEFAGSGGRMATLQDFILDKEEDVPKTEDVIISCLFRDLGKGYKTERLNQALAAYQKANPTAYALVTVGPLNKFLKEAMTLGPKDDLACFTLAMDVLIALNELSQDEQKCKQAAKDMKEQESKSSMGGKEETSESSSEDEKESASDDVSSSGESEDSSASDGSDKDGKENKDTTKSSDKITASSVNKIAKELLKSPPKELDASSALRKALAEILSNNSNKITRSGPSIYRPFSTAFDQVVDISPDNIGTVARTHKEVRSETNYLRTRLRHLFRATELVDVEHGMRVGRNISERMLTESVCMVRNNHRPDRPFYDTSEAPDMSMSAVIVLDESSSMHSKLERSGKILLALTDSLDSIGCKTSVVGFMKSYDYHINEIYHESNIDVSMYHRNFAMKYHIFKRFEERFHYIKNRFGSMHAQGDTPMGDGINFALNQLSSRKEGHRFIFVVTDGQPDDYGPVNNRIEAATSIGIKTIGVGLGQDASYVQKCFPDHVWAKEMNEIPALLVRKLTTIVERNEMRRGRRLSKHLEVR